MFLKEHFFHSFICVTRDTFRPLPQKSAASYPRPRGAQGGILEKQTMKTYSCRLQLPHFRRVLAVMSFLAASLEPTGPLLGCVLVLGNVERLIRALRMDDES